MTRAYIETYRQRLCKVHVSCMTEIPRATPGIRLFALFVFVLAAVPRLNVQIGPIPLYLMDLLIVALIVKAMKSRPFPGRRPFEGIIVLLFWHSPFWARSPGP